MLFATSSATATRCSQSSIEPERYCVWLSKANHTYRVALRSTHLAIHFLTSADLPLAELFGTRSGDSIDKFAGLAVSPGPAGVPFEPLRISQEPPVTPARCRRDGVTQETAAPLVQAR